MLDLELLGLSKEELQNRVVETIANRMMEKVYQSYDGEDARPTRLYTKLEQRTQQMIDKGIDDLAQKYVLPNVKDYLENLCLQKTNEWGEKRGEKTTFIEYLTKRAENYMREKVDYEGKGRDEVHQSYGFDGRTTRVAYMVDKHLHYAIESSMQKAFQSVNSQVAGGLKEAVEDALKRITSSLQISFNTKTK